MTLLFIFSKNYEIPIYLYAMKWIKKTLCLKQNMSIILLVGLDSTGEDIHTQDGYLNWGICVLAYTL